MLPIWVRSTSIGREAYTNNKMAMKKAAESRFKTLKAFVIMAIIGVCVGNVVAYFSLLCNMRFYIAHC